MEATYLAWLDCRETGIPGSPFRYFLKEAQVALNDGVEYGRGGEGFVRLNFGCPRGTLTEALERMGGRAQAPAKGPGKRLMMHCPGEHPAGGPRERCNLPSCRLYLCM